MELVISIDLYPEFVVTYIFGMSYYKTDECKKLISENHYALMVLKNKLFLKIKKKKKTSICLKLKTRAEDSPELRISKCSLANKEIQMYFPV